MRKDAGCYCDTENLFEADWITITILEDYIEEITEELEKVKAELNM